jgi:hypothetical protein
MLVLDPFFSARRHILWFAFATDDSLPHKSCASGLFLTFKFRGLSTRYTLSPWNSSVHRAVLTGIDITILMPAYYILLHGLCLAPYKQHNNARTISCSHLYNSLLVRNMFRTCTVCRNVTEISQFRSYWVILVTQVHELGRTQPLGSDNNHTEVDLWILHIIVCQHDVGGSSQNVHLSGGWSTCGLRLLLVTVSWWYQRSLR